MPHTPIPKQLADISNQPQHDHCQDNVTVPAQGAGATDHPSDVILRQRLDQHQLDFSQSIGDNTVNIFSCSTSSSLCHSTSAPLLHSQSTLIPIAFHVSPWQAHRGNSGYIRNDVQCVQQWVLSQNMFLSVGSHRQLCPRVVCLPLEKRDSQPEGRPFQVAFGRSADLYS